MKRVFDDIKSLMGLKSMSVDTLAAALYKEPASIRKQLNPVSANPQLSTLVQIASAIGGEVRVLPVDSEDESVEAYRNRLALFQQEREQMLTDAARLNEIIEQQRITIETQAQQIEELHKERDMRVRYLGKVFDDLDAEMAANRELRRENKDLMLKIMKLKGVEL